jgi:outer membrane protein TolC
MRRPSPAILSRSLLLWVIVVGPALLPAAYGFQSQGQKLSAPQLRTNPMAGRLQAQLDELREKLKKRSRLTSLQDAVEQSLLNNPTLAQSYSEIQQQQWSLIAVRRQWYPQLNANNAGVGLFGYRGLTSNSVNSNARAFTPSTTYRNLVETSPSLQLRWTFFDPSRGASINAASESLRAQKLLFDVTARNLVLETQLAYFLLQEQLQLVGDYEVILNSTSEQVERTEALFNAGARSLSDVEQIRTQQLQNLTQLIQTYRRLVDASARLAAAMALPTGALVMPQDKLSLLGRWKLTEVETLQQAEQLREEILASLAQASSSGWQATALFYSYWPNFSTNASGSFASTNTVRGNPGSEETLNSQETDWTGAVGLGFNWKIFDGGISAAQAEQRKAVARQFKNQAAMNRLVVASQVERAYAGYQASILALESTRQQLYSAEVAAKVVRERFSIGFEDMTSVVQTYNQSIFAATAYAQSIREFNSAVAELYRYSASWPDGALPLLQTRVEKMK